MKRLNLTKKQTLHLFRIVGAGVLLLVAVILSKTGVLPGEVWYIALPVFLIPYLLVGWDVIRAAVVNLFGGQLLDEHFLMMIATVGAFVIGEYPEAVFVMLFYQVGELFQSIAVGRSRRSIAALMEIRPDVATVERNGTEITVSPSDVAVGEVLIIRPGEKIPLDGCVIEGRSELNTVSLTGESAPRDVTVGDSVISGCVNVSGLLRVKVEKPFGDSIRLSTRPDAIDAAVLKRLKDYGVETVELGAQSMDDEVLLLSGRGHRAEDVEMASRQIKGAGFRLILQMMTGLPGDSDERSLDTARRIAALKPDGVRIYPTVIVRDTALYDLWRAGRYEEHTVEDAVRCCAKLLPVFEEAGIPVIRLGLNPTDELSGGDAAGGAYHPALGELVKSRIMLEKARGLLQGAAPGSAVVLAVDPSKISQMVGQHRQNIQRLCTEFGLCSLKVIGKALKNDEIEIVSVEIPAKI